MNVVYLGSGQFGLDCLDALERSGHKIQMVVTQPPNPAGRGRKPNPTPVAQWATTRSVPFVETHNANEAPIIEQIARCEPDVIVVIAFGQKIGPELTDLPAQIPRSSPH